MKLAKIKEPQSRFKVPFKLYKDDEDIAENYQLVATDVYQAVFQYALFEDGKFDYNDNQINGVIAMIDNRPFVFVTDAGFIIEQIPFDTKVDISNGHIFVRGIFAIQASAMNQYEQMKQSFEEHVKQDLLNNIQKQIDDLNSAKKYLD